MNILSSFCAALGLSMDNFAVTVASGCSQRCIPPRKYILKVSLLFTLAHFVMFSAGYWGGEGVARFMGALDHWLAFGILAFIGLRMIKESFEKKESETLCTVQSFKTLLALAVATSLDALLVGMGMAFSHTAFWPVVCMLSACVFVTSAAGFYLGMYLGRKLGSWMELFGGTVLIAIGLKLLLEGLGIW